MILCDASVIVGAINAADGDHLRCIGAIRPLKQKLVTTHACIAEAMHLLNNYAGWSGQASLIEWIETDFLLIHCSSQPEDKRACILMREYSDTPMDYADASLVAAAESLGITCILTLDRHFYTYRINGKTSFQLSP
jgi:hypothetical protein